MKMRNLMVAILMLLASAAVADEVRLGYFGVAESYDAASLSASIGQINVYAEHAGEWDYTLAMVDTEVNENLRIGLRFDSPSDLRPYVTKSLSKGDFWLDIRWLVGGLGGAKQCADVFAGVRLKPWLTFEGWECVESGSLPQHCWGPKVRYREYSIWYGIDFGPGKNEVLFNRVAFTW